jgi:thiosulfate reductase cytochrome b subunit
MDTPASKSESAATGRVRKVLVARHKLATRVTHWINVVAFLVLLFSGLAIYNAHPALYWGQKTDFDHPWLAMTATPAPGGKLVGHTRIGGADFVTTGVLGASDGVNGKPQARGFPTWLTLPPHKSLSDARHWHFFFIWLLVLNGLAYLIFGFWNGHLPKDLTPTKQDLKEIPHEIATHARLQFPKDERATRYNVLQKLAYGSVVFVAFPLLIVAGMALSPRLDAGFHLPDLLFGRQSARSLHFIMAWAIVAFLGLHLFMVVVSGTWNNIRSMITGKYAIEVPDGEVPDEGPTKAEGGSHEA